MSINIVSYPNREIDRNPLKVSKWNAVHHPIKFELQRKDFEMSIGWLGGTSVQITTNLANGLIMGEVVMFLCTDGQTGTAEVTAINTTTIFTATVLTGSFNTTGRFGFINLNSRLNYYIKTKIWGVDSTDSYYEIGVSINKPDTTGRSTVDVSSFLKTIVGYTNDFDYTTLNWKDNNLGGRFNISMSENWTGYTGAFSGISETDLNYFVNAAKQIQDVYGSNMGDFVPFFTTLEEQGEKYAKFLSDFEKPTYFIGFPFDLSFIYSELIYGYEIKRHEQKYDINRNTSGSLVRSNPLTIEYGLAVNRLMLTEVTDSTVKTMDVYLGNTEGSTPTPPPVARLAVTDDYVDSGYFEEKTGLPTISTANIENS